MTRPLTNPLVLISMLGIMALIGLMVAQPMQMPTVSFAAPVTNDAIDLTIPGAVDTAIAYADETGPYVVTLQAAVNLPANLASRDIPFPDSGTLTLPLEPKVRAFVNWRSNQGLGGRGCYMQFGTQRQDDAGQWNRVGYSFDRHDGNCLKDKLDAFMQAVVNDTCASAADDIFLALECEAFTRLNHFLAWFA